MSARWEAADGFGPLPGDHAAREALRRGLLPLARRAVAIARAALRRREAEFLNKPAPAAPEQVIAAFEPEFAGLLGELAETGRPVRSRVRR